MWRRGGLSVIPGVLSTTGYKGWLRPKGSKLQLCKSLKGTIYYRRYTKWLPLLSKVALRSVRVKGFFIKDFSWPPE